MATLTQNETAVVSELEDAKANFSVTGAANVLKLSEPTVRGTLTSLTRKGLVSKVDGEYQLDAAALKTFREEIAKEEADKANRPKTKKDIALEIFEAHKGKDTPRKDIIKELKDKAELTDAGAATYYQNIFKA